MNTLQTTTTEPINPRDMVVLLLLTAALLVACGGRMLVGDPLGLPAGQMAGRFLEIRLQQMIMGLVVGASLSVAGTLLQALLRNPLASPYLLGISSGAALGVMLNSLLVFWGVMGVVALMADHLAAAGGAILTLIVIYLLAQKRGWIDPLGLLLVGVIVNAINGAAIMFINYLSPHGLRANFTTWMMGYLNDNATWTEIGMVGGMAVIGLAVAIALGRALDVATFSDAEAHAMGLNVKRLRLGVFVLAGLITSGTVILAGPIGFVGLVCPHFVRLLIGPRHRPLLIGAALAGGTLIVGADTLIRLTDIGQGRMPIGIVMALIGGPVFLWMLRGQLGRGIEQ